MIVSFIILIIFLISVGSMQYYFFEFDLNFYESIAINLISSVIMIFPTVFILEKLIKRHNKKVLEKNEKSQYLNTLSTRHNILTSQLEMIFIHFVTKKPADIRDEYRDIKLTLNKLDNYVDEDFLRNGYKIHVVDPSNTFNFQEINLSYQKFCKYEFKDKTFNIIADYTSRYVVFIPKAVLESLFKIEDTIKNNIFTVPEDHGSDFDISKAKFNPNQFIQEIRTIGNEIVKMKKYEG
ncbi:hypothetical protein NC661_06465 [Aquibacillus koreensis]|uniref:Uncharacterized protein n=1 Tax=Aquibacillus koreensis TaxID=279446 RepID=A0A9X4AJ21_9BACI|nr:hypothetical protein [Aquibacillus koreensis]MCT2535705.1 hypothetical protein [Aquibacillus koreensis]MDC3420010.1 hypothetical protein [Aquibacillus koreensis]